MNPETDDLRFCTLSAQLVKAATIPKLRKYCLRFAFQMEGGHYFSGTARKIVKLHYGVSIGAYSYGECFTPGFFQRNTVVGRYVSVAPGVRTYVRDHPLDRISTHPFFFNSRLGMIDKDTIPFGHLQIGHDAWLGSNVVVTKGCKRIGIGAVVAAGAIVTRDVENFAIVGGTPAKLIRYRFPDDIQGKVLDSKWWNLPIHTLIESISEFSESITQTPQNPIFDKISKLNEL